MTRIVEGPTLENNDLNICNFLHNFRTERLGQRAVQVIGDVCFGFFVFTVLLFTVIAITYKPPDPWLQEQKSLNVLFNSVGGNSSFHPDDSVLLTGDDFTAGAQALPLPSPMSNGTQLLECNISKPWNCSDLGLKLAVETLNARHFPELLFYSYTIVSGGAPGVCDVAWLYRPKNISNPRLYQDYRRISAIRNSDCSFEVTKLGKWHSGTNVRESPTSSKPLTERTMGKYLSYTRGNEYCKSMGQWMWGFLCALGEAQYLNRTFVVDLDLCLSAECSSSYKNELGKDFRFYFDLEHLANMTSIIEKSTFEEQSRTLDSLHVLHNSVTPAALKNDAGYSVVYREFSRLDDADNYWSSVCDGQAGAYIQGPWNFLWKSKLLMNIVDAICNKLEWDFDVVHVIRGYKAQNKKLWPNLDGDTSPESLIAKLRTMIGFRRRIYIASDEPYEHYFDRLREPFQVQMLHEFSYLWAENSEWWNATRRIAPGQNVTFDGYMKMIVDTEMLYRGRKRVETFNDLTKDCKNGAGRC